MAADTRPYKSKEQDGQGNEVIIRDQQLVEQSTVTTMPSGACFETLDIDGRPVKIPRDNMMSIVLECIGIVLNDSSKNLGTNVNKALGLQGNTIGNVTVNDFASVLGVELNKYDGSTTDAQIPDLKSNHQNTIETGSWSRSISSNCPPAPEGYNGGQYIWIPTVRPQNGNTFGILIATAMTSTYQIKYYYCSKWFETWDAWHELS